MAATENTTNSSIKNNDNEAASGTGQNRIDSVFARLKAEGKTALMPYLMGGFPDAQTSLELIVAADKSGADLIEFGIPYSDPLADGPTIQAAAEEALANGINTDTVFDIVEKARQHTQIPVVVMTYYNTIYRYGIERFAKRAAECGIDGTIIPDLPVEESHDWVQAADRYNLNNVMLVTPTSTPARIKMITGASKGFIYCVSLTGVTGARADLPRNLTNFIGRVKDATEKPVAIGFGISEPHHAKQVAEIADGAIIGSALVKIIKENSSNTTVCVEAASNYLSKIREALDE
jgi:tryptophan synthase alpha chain